MRKTNGRSGSETADPEHDAARKVRTDFLLLALYDGRACIPADLVARDFFGLTKEQFVRKLDGGEIDLPLIRIESSSKAARLVHVNDLAAYVDRQSEDAAAFITKLFTGT